jgi:hypothetical protein
MRDLQIELDYNSLLHLFDFHIKDIDVWRDHTVELVQDNDDRIFY